MNSTHDSESQKLEPVTDADGAHSEPTDPESNVIPLRAGSDLVRVHIQDFLDRGTGQRALARQIGTHHRSLMSWLHNTRPVPDVQRAVTKWLANSQLQSRGRCYVRTPASASIQNTLTHAQLSGDFVIIHGGPGVGKTTATRRYCEDHRGAFLITVDPTTSGLIPALETVAEALGITDATGGAKRVSALIRRHLEARPGALIVIDEAQHLSMAAIEALRAIHDATGMGLALMGNDSSYSRLIGGPRAAHYAQIRSRIGVRLCLSKPTLADLEHLAAAWGLTDSKCIAVLHTLAARPGALRIASKALFLCVQSGKEITEQTLLSASVLCGAEI